MFYSVDVLAWGPLEWTFVVILIALTGVVGILFLFIVARFFVNPGRKPKPPGSEAEPG